MLLLRVEPEQGSRLKGKPAPAHHIGDGSSDDQVQLQLNVVMAFELRRVSSGLHEVEEAVIALAEF